MKTTKCFVYPTRGGVIVTSAYGKRRVSKHFKGMPAAMRYARGLRCKIVERSEYATLSSKMKSAVQLAVPIIMEQEGYSRNRAFAAAMSMAIRGTIGSLKAGKKRSTKKASAKKRSTKKASVKKRSAKKASAREPVLKEGQRLWVIKVLSPRTRVYESKGFIVADDRREAQRIANGRFGSRGTLVYLVKTYRQQKLGRGREGKWRL